MAGACVPLPATVSRTRDTPENSPAPGGPIKTMRMLAGLPEAVWASNPAMRLSSSPTIFFSRSTWSVSDPIFVVFFCSGRAESGLFCSSADGVMVRRRRVKKLLTRSPGDGLRLSGDWARASREGKWLVSRLIEHTAEEEENEVARARGRGLIERRRRGIVWELQLCSTDAGASELLFRPMVINDQ
jgi:hypothetical protein